MSAVETVSEGEIKDLYEVGEIPPLGHVPKQMYAWAIRRERHGPPEEAMQLEIVETPPSMKGASATSRTKPAKLSTGLEVQVPEYLEIGETIKVNTSNAKFMSRA